MNRKKAILIAVFAIIMMVIIGQSYIIHNQARFDGDRKYNWLTPITLRLGCALAREEMVVLQPRSAQKIPQAEFFNKEHDIQLSCLVW